MRLHRTTCPKCGLYWDNTDDRDYSQDKCPNCKVLVIHKVVDEKRQANGLPVFCSIPDKSVE